MFQLDPTRRFHVELADDELLLHDARSSVVHRAHRRDVERLLAGRRVARLDHLPVAAFPVIRTAISPSAVGRRSVLVGSGSLAATGILATALPFAAAAVSLTVDSTTYATEATLIGGVSSTGVIDYSAGGVRFVRYELQGETSVQVELGGTRGTRNQSGVADAGSIVQGTASGAYIVATISNLPGNGNLVFEGRRGGPGGGAGDIALRGGTGGNAVGLWYFPPSGANEWLVVAGGAGGDSDAASGGGPGQPGTGDRPGGGARFGIGGVAGQKGSGNAPTAGADAIANPEYAGNNLQEGGTGGGVGTGFIGGGGGGTGFAGGGGGGDASTISQPSTAGGGGGGGSVFVRESAASGPYVSDYSISTAPRDWTFNGSTLLYKLYVPAGT